MIQNEENWPFRAVCGHASIAVKTQLGHTSQNCKVLESCLLVMGIIWNCMFKKRRLFAIYRLSVERVGGATGWVELQDLLSIFCTAYPSGVDTLDRAPIHHRDQSHTFGNANQPYNECLCSGMGNSSTRWRKPPNHGETMWTPRTHDKDEIRTPNPSNWM